MTDRSARPSLPDRIGVPSWARKLGWILLGWCVPASAATAVSYVLLAAGSVVTTPKLQAAMTVCEQAQTGERPTAVCRVADLEKRVGTPVENDAPPVTFRITALETARVAQVESVGLTMEEVVGLRVSLFRTESVVRLTPAQRDAIEAASVAARAKYRQIVQQTGDVHKAASQVLAEAGVPR